ncbi:MAG: hypothetical protein AB7W59_30330 [Acidimicrobiia bacterium]
MAHTRHVLKDLDREWEQLAASTRALRQLRLWRLRHDCFECIDGLSDLVAAIRTGDRDGSIELVWALLDLAAEDELAVRTLLQVVVPGLAGELRWLLEWARRTDPGLLDGGDVDQLLVVAALEAIRHAVGQRKPWPVMSILRRAHRVLRRETATEEQWHKMTVLTTTMPATAVAETDESPAARLASVLDEASQRGAVSRDDAALVWLTRVGGYQPVELEARFDATGDCLRRRRHRAEARLAQWAEAV